MSEKKIMNERLRILILAANPVNTPRLKLEREHRLLRNRMRGNVEASTCEILAEWAARLSEVQDALKTYRPHVVHFAGHGDEGGICLEDDEGGCRLVGKGELTLLLNSSKEHLRLVTLNACSSVAQMEQFGQLVDYIVGTESPIEDDAAVRFTAHFYEAVALGGNVREAFHKAQGKLTVGGEGAQANNYRLLVRPGTDETEPLLPPFYDNSTMVNVADEISADDIDVANKLVEGPSLPADEQRPSERNRLDIRARRMSGKKISFANDLRRNS